MKDLLAKVAFDLPKVGSTLEGEIISTGKNSVLVDLDSLGTGIVYPGEFYDNTTLQKALKPGQRVAVILLDLENEDGWRELSLKRAQLTTAWQDIKNKKDSGEVITTKIININKGGLIVEVNGIPGFLPLSQLAPEHYPKVEGGDTTKIVQALQKLRNTDIQVKIIDYFEDENRLIVSEKAINDQQLLAEVAKFKVGDVVSGTVTDVTDFGAFVKLTDNLEGLVHISEIDWKLIDNPRDFLTPGQPVEAKIIEIDGTKISLSLKALKPDPWQKVEEKYSVGQKLAGEVTRLTNFGVFVRLDEEIFGLIPASEFGDRRPSEVLRVGDQPTVAIVSIDPKEHKMLLTLETSNNEEKSEEKITV
ncbi:MAG: S1 RNA-binding domain-containing protein [Patescibacteria group bacterium]